MNSPVIDRRQDVEISVVIPVYNSASIFPELYRRLTASLERVSSSYEVIAVLDGCRDNSYDVISGYATGDSRIHIIEFSRNFGHQAALTAGLGFATGRYVIIMDDDLEDPPELIQDFVETARKGFDVVYGIRRRRKRSLLMRLSYSAFYRVMSLLVDINIPRDAGDFCLMSRRVVEVLKSMPENNRYLRGMRAWAGFPQTGIEYERQERYADASGYSLRKYFSLALDGIFSFSYTPLKYVTAVGIIIAIVSFEEVLRILYLKMTGRINDVPGWAYLSIAILFLSGIQLIAMGIIGEYIARIYDEVKKRPNFVIKRQIGKNEDRPG